MISIKAIQIKENVYWVGGVDWNIRNFHGYLTQRGSTYNAYLIIDEKITLIDTVKHYLFDEMLERISDVIDPADIDYVISNHVEQDHSGSLPEIMEIATKATLVTSPNGEKGLKAHFREDWNYRIVKSGDVLNIGKRNLTFVQTPMVHWPDNMVTYLEEDKILFSNDAFGQHIASTERFDDELPLGVILEEARKYYANIVLPYGGQVQKALGTLGGLDVEVIATSHGLIWRSNIPAILNEYQKWSTNATEKKAVIVYDTMWNATEIIAESISDVFEKKGYNVRFMDLKNNHISDIMTEVITAKYICVGSPTLNNNLMPSVASFLTYLKGLAPKDRIGLAFGSYGWSGQSIGQVEQYLKDCGFETLENIRIQYIPEEDQLEEMKEKLEGNIL
ncbi:MULTISPECIES: FprA family A-type flavoprotein [unclassified Dehalobacter]|uniref:FprA family A-type flavoprotein n=1 Tax=unclassified Dehalobacter TaxID=2635733 RepID=UPI00028AA1E0|nr:MULTISPECIES: FprA family A-type flavoprotein [unclassified Dehalobacter]AFV03320.1 rubredoxin-oxygen oxidoreductase [Dehalobacter sp. DCA]AFV06308.1 rubredoxin-oxygen oxidoreductase [Dehalobacter sp. CF]